MTPAPRCWASRCSRQGRVPPEPAAARQAVASRASRGPWRSVSRVPSVTVTTAKAGSPRGYDAEAVFGRAFKRTIGRPPSTVRR